MKNWEKMDQNKVGKEKKEKYIFQHTEYDVLQTDERTHIKPYNRQVTYKEFFKQ